MYDIRSRRINHQEDKLSGVGVISERTLYPKPTRSVVVVYTPEHVCVSNVGFRVEGEV